MPQINTRPELRKINGGILPLMAVLLLPLIIVMGFAIDTGLVLNSKNQQALLVQHGALSALSQYVQSLAEAGNVVEMREERIAEAVELTKKRISRVAKSNVTIIDKTLHNKSDRIAVTTSKIASKTGSGTERSDVSEIEENEEATLEFGRYYYTDEDDICGGKPPCFVPGNPLDVDENNAVRFTMQIKKSNPINTFILKLIGIPEIVHKESAIATLIPRNDVFLVDLSPSAYFGNYNSDDIDAPGTGPGVDTGTASRFTFQINADPETGAVPAICPATNYTADICMEDGLGVWKNMPNNAAALPCGGSSEPACPLGYRNAFNFKNEYRLETIKFTHPSGPYYTVLLVHSNESDSAESPPIPKPEPLTSILRSVHRGMEILIERALSTDNLGVFGFDSDKDVQVSPDASYMSEYPRNFNMTVPSKGSSSDDFKEIFQATNFKETEDFELAIKKGLIPRGGDRQSDVHGSIFMGLQKIAESKTYKFAKNSIFLFTDGLSNCPRKLEIDELNPSIISVPLAYEDLNLNWACDPTGAHFVHSIKGITDDNFIKALTDRDISVSIALVGKQSAAHYVARKSKTGGCMDYIEASSSDYKDYIDSGFMQSSTNYADPAGQEFINQIDNDYMTKKPLYIVNELYKLVHATKGLWIPIMPPLKTGGTTRNFRQELETQCDSIDSEGDTRVKNFHIDGIQVTDGAGRVLYDPDGRTIEDQMKDAMEMILQSPFVLAP